MVWFTVRICMERTNRCQIEGCGGMLKSQLWNRFWSGHFEVGVESDWNRFGMRCYLYGIGICLFPTKNVENWFPFDSRPTLHRLKFPEGYCLHFCNWLIDQGFHKHVTSFTLSSYCFQRPHTKLLGSFLSDYFMFVIGVIFLYSKMNNITLSAIMLSWWKYSLP